jgi:hypothetical protein
LPCREPGLLLGNSPGPIRRGGNAQAMDESIPEPPRHRRRWFSLSLRGLMLLVLVVGGVMGWKARRARLQQRAVATIQGLHGSVIYDWEYDWEYAGNHFMKKPASVPPGPSWLRRALGDEYFQDVAAVILPTESGLPPAFDESREPFDPKYARLLLDDQLACLDGLDRIENLHLQGGHLKPEGLERLARLGRLKDLTLIIDALDADRLAHLGGLTNLERLSVMVKRGDVGDLAFLDRLTKLRSLQLIEGPVTDAGLAHIGRLSQLETLYIDGSELTDAGLAHLEGLKALERLTLYSASGITDAGLAHLEGLSELVDLELFGTPLSDEGLQHFRNLPKLRTLLFAMGRISDRAIKKMKETRPGLRILVSPAPSGRGAK